MDIKEIKQIIDLMKKSDLVEFEIEEADLKLRIRRDSVGSISYSPTPASAPVQAQSGVLQAPVAITSDQGAAVAADEPGVELIKSPMVGTFYRAPSPDSKSFVEKGDSVTAESVVCIIEAMKVMNEIQAEIAGEIIDVLADNGQSVEYGQPLFKVRLR